MGRTRRYIDFGLIEKYPNKYNLTPAMIKKLVIKDWDRLKKKCWHNEAMANRGIWYCHIEGCQKDGENFDAGDEFWIGFCENNNSVDCNFTCYEGMCGYNFDNFYSGSEIENVMDMQVQANAIKWLNEMIDNGILGLPEE